MFHEPIKVNNCKTELIFSINLFHLTFHPLVKTGNLSIILDGTFFFTLGFLCMSQSISAFSTPFMTPNSVYHLIFSSLIRGFLFSGQMSLQLTLHSADNDFSKMQIICMYHYYA